MDVAALYVDPKGPYPTIAGVDAWDLARDARNYRGPLPAVAHPPCQLWVNFAALNFKRYGGDHNRPGNDGGCFRHALGIVRTWGGVLEHPASSNAWPAFNLTRPSKTVGEWTQVSATEWVVEVWQAAYGHKARKRTWLLYVGINPPLAAKREREREEPTKLGGLTESSPRWVSGKRH